MKQILSILFVFVCVCTLEAQEPDFGTRFTLSPRWSWGNVGSMRGVHRSFWNGDHNWSHTRFYLTDPEGKADLGLTPEQEERLPFLQAGDDYIFEWSKREMQNESSEYRQSFQLAENLLPAGDKLLEKASPAEIESYRDDYIDVLEHSSSIFPSTVNQEIESVLTEEQLLKLRTVELQLGLSTPASFEALGLSDEQKEEMAAIKKQADEEFEQWLDEAAKIQLDYLGSVTETLKSIHKETPFTDPKELTKKLREVEKICDNEEIKKRRKSLSEKIQNLTDRTRTKLMNVLTDEQLDTMTSLLASMPNAVRKRLRQLQQIEEENKKSDDWMPGPDSWRPGDGAPEEFKRQRQAKKAFPTTE